MSSPKVLRLRDVRRPPVTGELLSLTQVCDQIGLQEVYVYAATRNGWLRTVTVGRRVKYLSWEVAELAARLRERDPVALRAGNRTRFLLDEPSPQVA